jgi:signal transduction protein with GAF and PtsI domain
MVLDMARVRFAQPEAFAALREIARSLSAAWDLDTTLDLIVRKTTEVMRVDSCTLYLLDPDGQTLRLRATTGLARQALGLATLRVGEGMTGHAVAEGQPVFAADARHDPHFKWVDDTEETRFRSLLAVPLVIEARPIGALNVQTVAPLEYPFEAVETLSLIADLAAGALAKAQIHDRQLRQLEELRTLAEVSAAITSPGYLDDILDVVTEMAAHSLGAAVCAIFLLDESGSTLERHAGQATVSGSRWLAGDSSPATTAGTGLLGRVVSAGEAVYIADIRGDLSLEAAARLPGTVSLLAVPLSVRERTIGVLACYTAARHDFSDEQVTLLTTLANQTALAIENARLVSSAAVVREMHHRIKNNLQTVAMLMQLQLPDADHLDARRVLLTNIDRIRSIAAVHEILSEQSFRLVDARAVLERIVQGTLSGLSRPNQDIRITVHGESLQLPSRAATALAVVVNELVQNSLEHAFIGRDAGRIDISLGRSPDELIVLVRDDGIGLRPDYERRLGLDLAETLIGDDLGGNLVFNRLDAGTEAVIRLPRRTERLEPAD